MEDQRSIPTENQSTLRDLICALFYVNDAAKASPFSIFVPAFGVSARTNFGFCRRAPCRNS
jgi:hypothetical protein